MDPPGELNPKIKILAPLRCGGVGSLDCAEDMESGTRLAIRWLPLAANGEAAARALNALPFHPLLPKVRGTGFVGSAAYVAMEFPEGRLFSSMQNEPLAASRLASLGAELADALAAVHSQNVVHGDLSADSILVLPDGRAILWDLPLVLANRLTDRRLRERETAKLAQTCSYLAPERARGAPASFASDVFALGAVLCRAAGAAPPPANSVVAILHTVASGSWVPEVPSGLPERLRSVLARMIHPDPSARPTAREAGVLLARPSPLRFVEPFFFPAAPRKKRVARTRAPWVSSALAFALGAALFLATLFGVRFVSQLSLLPRFQALTSPKKVVAPPRPEEFLSPLVPASVEKAAEPTAVTPSTPRSAPAAAKGESREAVRTVVVKKRRVDEVVPEAWVEPPAPMDGDFDFLPRNVTAPKAELAKPGE